MTDSRVSWKSVGVWFATWALAQVVLVGVPVWVRAGRYCFSNFDLGIYSQALAQLSWSQWNPLMSGRQLYVFNDHFDPIIVLAAPFTRVASPVYVGLFVESLCTVLALVPLGWLAREGRLALRTLWLLGALLALHVGVTQALGFPFHPTTWAVLPMAWLGAAVLLERRGLACVALLVLLCCKEEFPFVGLMLGVGLWRWGSPAWRRVATFSVVISVIWVLWVFVVRPRVLGAVMPYSAKPFEGLEAGVRPFLAARFSARSLAAMGDLLAALVPLLGWLTWSRRELQNRRLLAVLVLPLLPLLSIRFLAMAWREQYGAVVVASLVMAAVAAIGTRVVPWWVLGSTLVLLGLTNERTIVGATRDYFGPVAKQSPGCPALPGRVEAVTRALEQSRPLPGPLLIGGNLLPWVAERTDVYAIDGPAPAELVPAMVLMEKPPRGDHWAVSEDRNAEVLELAREHFTHVLIDDEFVFLATL